ncbi:MAG: hypothetical protein J6C85_06805 [Alphaproteobacteria bacterium]|nr:hypothetical protein [Alphaproteobacteria bacterium]
MKLFLTNERGRSMIEMLGVLAIVGILSVGGIAGYSKAMYTYRVNKLIDEYTLFISNILLIKEDLVKLASKSGNSAITPLLKDMGFIPNTWLVNGNYIFDSTSRKILLFKYSENKVLTINYYLKDFQNSKRPNKESLLLCQNLWLRIIKPYQDSLWRAWIWREGENNVLRYGKNFCNTSNNCITDMSLSEITEDCSSCLDEKNCRLAIDFE